MIDDLDEVLRELLPRTWSVSSESAISSVAGATGAPSAAEPDGMVVITAPDGARSMILIEAKRSLDPKLVPVVADHLARYQHSAGASTGMLIAPFLSPRTRELLANTGLGYADATGNLRLALESPAVFIEIEGAQSDPWAIPGDRPLRSLKGPTAGRVVRALIDFRPPYGVEQLARRSDTSLGSVSRVFSFLELEALIIREPRGPVTDVKWPDLLRRWSQDYSFGRSNKTRTFLEPRGLTALLQKLQAEDRHAVTGSLAAARVAPITASRLATVYVEDIDRAAKQFRLRPAETGGNVVLAEPFDKVVFDRTQTHEGVTYAAFSQVAVDLLTGPGRSPAEGDELISWMQEHEDAWRA